MKRMIENSEKIEEIADAVENSETTLTVKKQVNFEENINVYGGTIYNLEAKFLSGLMTPNITTPDEHILNIFEEADYYNLNGNDFSSIFVFNLGTALIITGTYDPGSGDGDKRVMTIKSNLNVDIQMISNGNEIYAFITDNEDGTSNVMINFDHTRADVSKSEYSFSFIIGKAFKQI